MVGTADVYTRGLERLHDRIWLDSSAWPFAHPSFGLWLSGRIFRLIGVIGGSA